eukprot:COSAG01_NODE_16802_length_1202_cov_29.503173_1_plen_317_part_10
MGFRVAVGGIEHETAQMLGPLGFSTSWDDFASNSLGGIVRGDELMRLGRNNSVVDGFVRGCTTHSLEVVPLIWAKARTGGPVNRACLERLVAELIAPLHEQEQAVDGVLLSLHGSFCAEEPDGSWVEADADGAILRAVRRVVGPSVRIFAVHDMHSNISQAMVEHADLLCIERTYPHVDMAERALHATDVLARTLAGHINPTMAWCSLPILWSARKMLDTENPFRRVVARLEEMAPGLLTNDFPSAAANIGINPADDGVAGVLSASVGLGYQHCNSPVNGACTIVVTDSDLELAQKLSNKLGSWIWEQRTEWIFEEP